MDDCRLLDSHFRSPSWRLQDLKRGQILYTRVVAFCAQLKKIDNAMVFMKQMQDLQMRVPVHLFLDIISNAAEVDECVAAFSLLSDLEMKQSIVSVVSIVYSCVFSPTCTFLSLVCMSHPCQ